LKADAFPSGDIFCHVVDNFGDIGITWRLARQLGNEFGIKMRLVVDDLFSLQKLVPATNPHKDEQQIEGVAVHRWHRSIALAPSDLVIEAFGCELPAPYIAAMAAAPRPPVWLNLEYLSAESWVDGHHLLPSIHPPTGLHKYFFFPGFGANTGGLLRERGLFAQRDRFMHDRKKQTGGLKVFIFAYPNSALPALLGALEVTASAGPGLRCTIPAGALADHARKLATRLNLFLPAFVAQQDFDEMLWSQDILFVRGEDSFIRAQWAAKPFIWQIYPQTEGVHWAKLDAFLDLYCAGLATAPAGALRRLTHAWNAEDKAGLAAAWDGFMAQSGALQEHAIWWAEELAKSPDLATNLVTFYRKTAKI